MYQQGGSLAYVGCLLILVAAVHCRYVDWSVTVPLQRKFDPFLKAAQRPVSSNPLKAGIELFIGMDEEDTPSSRS